MTCDSNVSYKRSGLEASALARFIESDFQKILDRSRSRAHETRGDFLCLYWLFVEDRRDLLLNLTAWRFMTALKVIRKKRDENISAVCYLQTAKSSNRDIIILKNFN